MAAQSHPDAPEGMDDPSPSGWRGALIVGALAWIVMALWALASPIGSVPDEPSHFIRAAAVVRGEVRSAQSVDNPVFGQATVPASVAHVHEWTCFAFNAQISAACMKPVAGDPSREVVTVTSAAVNSPGYYALVGWPSLILEGTPALYAMRLVSAAWCALALAVAAFYLPRVTRVRWTWLALTAALTPMVAYLGGSLNPNGLEATSAVALFVLVVALLRGVPTGRAQVMAIVWTAGMSGLMLSTRSISLAWALTIVVLATLLAGGRAWAKLLRSTAAKVGLGAVALVAVATTLWYLNPPHYESKPFAGVGTSVPRAFAEMLAGTFSYAEGYIGFFGWVDTHSPEVSVIAFSAVLVGLIAVAASVATGRRLAAVLVAIAAVLLLPAVIQGLLAPSMGFIWQGRYMLAMVMVTLVTAGIVLDDRGVRTGVEEQVRREVQHRLAGIALGLIAVGHSATFVWVLRRYVVGEDNSPFSMIGAAEWQPPGGWMLLALAYTAAVSTACVIAWREVATKPEGRPNTARRTVSRRSSTPDPR